MESTGEQHCCMCMVTKEWTEHMTLLLERVERGWNDLYLLQQEYSLLSKLLRKNRNQHRSTRFYKKLEHVQRLLKKLWVLREEMHSVGDGIPHVDVMKKIEMNIPTGILYVLRNACRSVSSLHERRVPTVGWGMGVLRSLLDQIVLAECIIKACYEAARQCTIQLAQSFFMPLSVACLAVASRMQVLTTGFLQNMCKDYTSFVEIACALPSVEENGMDLPEHIFCSVLRGKMPMVRMDARKDLLSKRNLLGIYRTDGARDRQSNDYCSVVEDHGQPVSREEVYGAMHDGGHAYETDVIPAFDTSNALILENKTACGSLEGRQQEIEEKSPVSMEQPQEEDSKVRITESVPRLQKRTTAFIRIGQTLERAAPKKVKEKPEPLKSWEDWIPAPSVSATDHVQKKKRRKR